MRWENSREVAGARHDDVVALFARRPARWFHTFLVLASLQAGPTPSPRDRGRGGRHWYRMTLPDADGTVGLVWHPRPQPGLFEGFTGELRVAATDRGAAITVAGEVTGGDASVTDAALNGLLVLLAAAIAERESAHVG